MRGAIRFGPLMVLGIGLISSGCSLKGLKNSKAASHQPSGKEEAGQEAADEADPQEASLRYKDFKPAKELVTVYFDYDRSELKEETLAALKQNAQWLKDNPKIEIQIQGHCDERGTVEYNLALGQRRAQSVRDYYKALGIRMRRMATISYGKEQPLCSESTDECWQRNRRAETLVRKTDVKEAKP